MKAQFLKIAGVKSEREFYQRFPTEESFFKAFPEALKSAQRGITVPGIVDGIGMGMPGIESTGNMFEELTPINNPFSTQSIVNNLANKSPINTTSSIGNNTSGLDKVGSQLPGLAGSVTKGISQIKSQKQKLKEAKQTNQLSGIYKTLSGIREQQPERRYVRPEDSLINPDQLFPSTGVGTNVLAKNGKNIDSYQFGGELSSIFSKGGLENLANSGIVDKGMSALFPGMDDSGGATIGGAIGGTAGTLIGGPIGGTIGKTAGKLIGGAFDKTGKKIKKEQKQTQDNLSTMMINNGATGMHQANYSYMEDGGLIPLMEEGGELQTHWGGHAETVSQNPYLEDGGETIMFRGNSHDEYDNNGNTGIGITYGNSPVEVERGEPATKIDDELVVYGNLQIPNQYVELFGEEAKNKKFKTLVSDWNKEEEKQNKFLEKSMTQLDKLNPLDPFDKLKFNALKANVLGANNKLKDIAEKKKIAANLQEAINTTAEEYGLEADALAKGKLKPISNSNMNIAKDGVTKKKNKIPKDKVESINIAKKPNYVQHNSNGLYGDISNNNIEQLKANNPWYDWDGFNPSDPTDVMNFQNEANKMLNKLGISERLDVDGKLGKHTASISVGYGNGLQNNNDEFAKGVEIPETVITKNKTSGIPKETPKKDSKLLNVLSSVMPYIRPSDAEPVDYNQLLGEMYALGNNQLEPVQAQSYQPQLRNPYDISLQDVLNENQADYRAQQRMVGNNPAAQAMLNSQKYAANQKVLGEQFRLNQANKDQVYSGNINTLNDARLKNLAIYDQQYDRQASARANTKATTQAALNSISSKYLQNDAANKKLQIYENLYGYRFDDQGRAVNQNGLAVSNTPQVTDGQDIPIYDNDGNIVGYRRAENQQTVNSVRTLPINPEKTNNTKSKKSLNGSIVKAIKNL